MVRRGPALCVGSGPSPLSPLGGSPWVTGCLQSGQEHQSSLVSSTRPTFLLAQPPPHHPPVRTHFFALQSSFHIQGTPQPPTAAVGETPFLQNPPGQGKTPGPAPQPDRVAPCPQVSELSLCPSLAVASAFPGRRRGCSISASSETEKPRQAGTEGGRETNRAAPGRCHGWFSSSKWAMTAAPWGREQAEQGRFMAVGQAQAEPNLLPSISFMNKMKCRTSSAGTL